MKSGFFPAHPAAIEAALRHIQCTTTGCHLLDPCAGEGAAVKQLAAARGAKPWAIELEEGRAEALKAAVPGAVGPASTFGVRCQGYFDWMWLNPPYDDEIGGGQRSEHTFLIQCSGWLKPKGLLCLVIPERIIGRYSPTVEYLRERYDDVFYMPFPEHVRKFKEVVVFGYKRDRIRELTDRENYNGVEPPLRLADDGMYYIQGGPGPRLFEKCELTEVELQESLERSPLQRLLKPPPPLTLPRPPLPVAKGHLAMLLASGHMDGLVKPDGEPPHVVRGTATKQQYLKEETSEEKDDGSCVNRQVFAEKICLTIRVLKETGEIVTLSQ